MEILALHTIIPRLNLFGVIKSSSCLVVLVCGFASGGSLYIRHAAHSDAGAPHKVHECRGIRLGHYHKLSVDIFGVSAVKLGELNTGETTITGERVGRKVNLDMDFTTDPSEIDNQNFLLPIRRIGPTPKPTLCPHQNTQQHSHPHSPATIEINLVWSHEL